jgi:NAD(P)-dependent dehydrogenase (short-subunit alcohol dehydrogenase family)
MRFTGSCLVIGGTASLAVPLLELAGATHTGVCASYRNSIGSSTSEVEWIHLDYGSMDSVNDFVAATETRSWSTIFLLSGLLSADVHDDNPYRRTQEVFLVNAAGPVYLATQLIASLEERAHLVFVSSRSAIRPSFDVNYAASKAALRGAVRSLARQAGAGQCVYEVVPTSIAGSRMFDALGAEGQKSHLARAGTALPSLQEFAEALMGLRSLSRGLLNGRSFEFGLERD